MSEEQKNNLLKLLQAAKPITYDYTAINGNDYSRCCDSKDGHTDNCPYLAWEKLRNKIETLFEEYNIIPKEEHVPT